MKCKHCGYGFNVLVGAEMIAGYLQMNPQVVRRMFRQGRLPGKKDGKRRWVTSKSLIDQWIVTSGAVQRKSKAMRSRNAVTKGSIIAKVF